MSKTIFIGGRLESKEKGNVVTGANAILDDTKGKKQNVINKETDDELLRLEQSKQDNLNFDNAPTENSTNPVTSGGVYTAEKALSDAIEAILLLIPSAATALNKLVDTNTMNSSISTATATFRGTYNAVSDLGLTYQATHAQIEAALDALGLTADNNDFAFVQIPVSDESQDIAKTERFKFNGTNWLYEYDLNTSGFTAAQWAAINSGITVALVTKLTDLPTAAALQLALNAKQDTLTFDNEPTALSQNPVTSGGIYLAIQAVATALSNYSDTTDNRLNTLEGLVPTEASSSNKLTDKAYVDGLIQAITELIPAEATTLNKLTDKAYVDGLIQAITELIPSEATSANQLADKAYVLAQILTATPAFKGQFVTLAELQAVASPKAGDLGIVRTKDSDGMDVFTVYQYLSNAWNVFYSLSYHPQTKPATTGTTGDYPYNGMGRVELAKNMVNTGTPESPVMVNQLTQDMFYKGAVGSRVPNTNTIFEIRYDYVLGENITVPENCVLEFDGGSISNQDSYTINFNNCGINASESDYILKNISVSNISNSVFYIAWIIGFSTIITTDDISRLPSTCCIDFSNRTLTCNSNINHTGLDVNWRNLTLISKGFTFGGYINKTTTCYKSYQSSPIIIDDASGVSVGDLALIVTSAGTPIDNRPDASGVPTLRTGILSKVRSISGNNIEIEDYIEAFNASTTYDGNVVNSTIEFCSNPVKINLENCKFYFLPTDANANLCGGATIYWCERSNIKNCLFEPTDITKGSLVLLSVSGAYNCSIINTEVNYALGADLSYETNYGIQFDCSTKNSVDNCKFFMNRRSVDFSGRAESRYNVVSNCIVGGSKLGAYGSGIGGHSTSFGNVYQNNLIEGPHSTGITCRGRNEKIMGNHLAGEFNLGFTLGYCTSVIGNTQVFVPGYPTINNVFASEDSQNLTLCTIKDNVLCVGASVFVLDIKRVICQNNTFIGPTTATMFASGISQDANSYYKGNKILENVSPNNVIYED